MARIEECSSLFFSLSGGGGFFSFYVGRCSLLCGGGEFYFCLVFSFFFFYFCFFTEGGGSGKSCGRGALFFSCDFFSLFLFSSFFFLFVCMHTITGTRRTRGSFLCAFPSFFFFFFLPSSSRTYGQNGIHRFPFFFSPLSSLPLPPPSFLFFFLPLRAGSTCRHGRLLVARAAFFFFHGELFPFFFFLPLIVRGLTQVAGAASLPFAFFLPPFGPHGCWIDGEDSLTLCALLFFFFSDLFPLFSFFFSFPFSLLFDSPPYGLRI